jgi:hypothetical protein
MSTGAVILAAGASSRLGRPKQLVTVQGETLVHRATRLALEAGCNPVVVVEGAVPLAPALADLSVDVVRCAEWTRGPGATAWCCSSSTSPAWKWTTCGGCSARPATSLQRTTTGCWVFPRASRSHGSRSWRPCLTNVVQGHGSRRTRPK